VSALADWAVSALLGSTVLMLFVFAVRVPVRRWLGPGLGYALWALPAVRIIIPPLPADLFAAKPSAANAGAKLSVLFVGAQATGLWQDPSAQHWRIGMLLLVAWLSGAAMLLGLLVGRHVRFRRRLLASATDLGRHGTVRIVGTHVDGPLAFGVFRRYVAVPRDFADRYDARERSLALAHECAHHARGDLIANWASLAMLAAHWWNPIAWAAIRAFRDDQEFAVDAHVLARADPGARPYYAQVLAKAGGFGALPVCNLNARSNLKGRLMMLAQQRLPLRRRMVGGTALTLLAASALAATVSITSAAVPAVGRQAVTIGVKPDGVGSYALIVAGKLVAPGAALPGGATLPSDFSPHGDCHLQPSAEPHAYVIKGAGGSTTYTVMCAIAKPASVHATLAEGLASLKTMRGMIATQQTTPKFPETERSHALGAVDRSIREVEDTLAKAN